jgi:hypothetical protein
MAGEHEIVFEDLHGVNEEQPVTVDLDADTKDDGISRAPAEQAADEDDGNDDDFEFANLRDAEDGESE